MGVQIFYKNEYVCAEPRRSTRTLDLPSLDVPMRVVADKIHGREGLSMNKFVMMFRGRKVFDGRHPTDIAERTLAEHGVPAEGTLEMVLWAGGVDGFTSELPCNQEEDRGGYTAPLNADVQIFYTCPYKDPHKTRTLDLRNLDVPMRVVAHAMYCKEGIPPNEFVIMFRGAKVFDGRTPSDFSERTLADHNVPANGTLELVMWGGGSSEPCYPPPPYEE